MYVCVCGGVELMALPPCIIPPPPPPLLTDDAVERGPQLVAHGGHEAILLLHQTPQLLDQTLLASLLDGAHRTLAPRL